MTIRTEYTFVNLVADRISFEVAEGETLNAPVERPITLTVGSDEEINEEAEAATLTLADAKAVRELLDLAIRAVEGQVPKLNSSPHWHPQIGGGISGTPNVGIIHTNAQGSIERAQQDVRHLRAVPHEPVVDIGGFDLPTPPAGVGG